jgi:hypothetical protein
MQLTTRPRPESLRASERKCAYCSLTLIDVAAWVVLITAGLIVVAGRVTAIRCGVRITGVVRGVVVITRVVVVVARIVIGAGVIVVSRIRSAVITLDGRAVVSRIVGVARIIVVRIVVAVRIRRAVEA